MQKLEVHSLLDLVAAAEKLGILRSQESSPSEHRLAVTTIPDSKPS